MRNLLLSFIFIISFFLHTSINKTVEYIKKERYMKSVIICSYNMSSLIQQISSGFNVYDARMLESILKDYLPSNWYDMNAKAEIYYINTQKSKSIQYISFIGSGKKIEIIFKDFEKSIVVEDAPSLSKIEFDPHRSFESYKLPRALINNIQLFFKNLPPSKQKYKNYKKLIIYYSSIDFSVKGLVFFNLKNQKEGCFLFNGMIVNRYGYSLKKNNFSCYFGLNSKYVITSKFGYRYHPIWKSRRFHSGIDLKVPSGTPVYAAYDGRIIFRGWINGYGNCIKITHGRYVVSLYGHLSKFVKKVKIGSKVKKGSLIAYSGSTGYSTAPHLHFEIRVKNTPVDPLVFKFFSYSKLSAKSLKSFKLFLAELESI